MGPFGERYERSKWKKKATFIQLYIFTRSFNGVLGLPGDVGGMQCPWPARNGRCPWRARREGRQRTQGGSGSTGLRINRYDVESTGLRINRYDVRTTLCAYS